MNSESNSVAETQPSASARRDLWVCGSLLVTSLVLAPLAYWRYERLGLGLLAVFALVILTAHWPANWIEARLARAERAVAGHLAATGIRMAVPLLVALLVVIFRDRWIPGESVLWMVPLYLSVLWADTIGHVQRRPTPGRVELPRVGSPRTREG